MTAKKKKKTRRKKPKTVGEEMGAVEMRDIRQKGSDAWVMRMQRTISHARHFYISLTHSPPGSFVGDEFQERGLAGWLLVMKQERKGSAGRGQETPAECNKEVTKQAKQRNRAIGQAQEIDLAFHLAALRDKIASRHRRQKVRRAIPAQKNTATRKTPAFRLFLSLSLVVQTIQKR